VADMLTTADIEPLVAEVRAMRAEALAESAR
jgi:hypothetical protein